MRRNFFAIAFFIALACLLGMGTSSERGSFFLYAFEDGSNTVSETETADSLSGEGVSNSNVNAGERQLVKIGGVVYAFLWVPGGSFQMGSSNDDSRRYTNELLHGVTLSHGFWMLESEVTQTLWQTVMEDNPSVFRGAELPVEGVSWNLCKQFVERLNEKAANGYKFRLPTEAEWERACLADSADSVSESEMDDVCWNFQNSGGKTHAVKNKKPNAWGFYDMLGNVSEWCEDLYGAYPDFPIKDPKGAAPENSKNRVCRGGSWNHNARACRAAFRDRNNPSFDGRGSVGLRLVLEAESSWTVEIIDSGIHTPEEEARIAEEEKAAAERAEAERIAAEEREAAERAEAERIAAEEREAAERALAERIAAEEREAAERAEAAARAYAEYGRLAEELGAKSKKVTIFGDEYVFRLLPSPQTSFIMGSPSGEIGRNSDEKQHTVSFKGEVWALESEVPQSLWNRVMNDNPSRFQGENLPVENVSWFDCQRFIEKIQVECPAPDGFEYSLPTEAEWEYASRADVEGSENGAPFGGDRLTELGWCLDNSGNMTHDVRSMKPNAWGFYDMHGNVAEWCLDAYSSNYSIGTNPLAVSTRNDCERVCRGGAWNSPAYACRCSARDKKEPFYRDNSVGLRLVLRSQEAEVAIVSFDVDSVSSQDAEPSEEVAAVTQEEEAVEVEAVEDKSVLITISDMELVFCHIPSGVFQMGSDENANSVKRKHEVTLSQDFWMMETEVSQELWQEIMGNNPSVLKGKDLPVTNVSWNDCKEFVAHLNTRGYAGPGRAFRLPTEAEWEYAARAGRDDPELAAFYARKDFGGACWYNGNSGGRMHSVKSGEPNEWGLLCMLGNVFEWCEDEYQPYSASAQANPVVGGLKMKVDKRVIRGGGWNSKETQCRVVERFYDQQSHVGTALGLRLTLCDDPNGLVKSESIADSKRLLAAEETRAAAERAAQAAQAAQAAEAAKRRPPSRDQTPLPLPERPGMEYLDLGNQYSPEDYDDQEWYYPPTVDPNYGNMQPQNPWGIDPKAAADAARFLWNESGIVDQKFLDSKEGRVTDGIVNGLINELERSRGN